MLMAFYELYSRIFMVDTIDTLLVDLLEAMNTHVAGVLLCHVHVDLDLHIDLGGSRARLAGAASTSV